MDGVANHFQPKAALDCRILHIQSRKFAWVIPRTRQSAPVLGPRQLAIHVMRCLTTWDPTELATCNSIFHRRSPSADDDATGIPALRLLDSSVILSYKSQNRRSWTSRHAVLATQAATMSWLLTHAFLPRAGVAVSRHLAVMTSSFRRQWQRQPSQPIEFVNLVSVAFWCALRYVASSPTSKRPPYYAVVRALASTVTYLADSVLAAVSQVTCNLWVTSQYRSDTDLKY